MGSFSKGMMFLVRIKYSLSMPFGMAASCFKSLRLSSLVFMKAVRMRLFQRGVTDQGLAFLTGRLSTAIPLYSPLPALLFAGH